jgi:hypothetical protein
MSTKPGGRKGTPMQEGIDRSVGELIGALFVDPSQLHAAAIV